MIIGIGSDIVDIQRITRVLEAHDQRFLERTFTSYERDMGASRKTPEARAAYFAKRWAAKEACAKALGTGFRGGILMQEIGVESDESGKPVIVLTGKAAETLGAKVPQGKTAYIHVSLSDDPPVAQAFVVIEAI